VVHIVPVILAGGQGTRLWPMSRSARPKQFLNLLGDSSLFQQALLRASDVRYSAPIIVTSSDYRFIVAEQAQEIGISPGAILLEPSSRNTAVAIAAAALAAVAENPDAIIHVLASDHAIEIDENYINAIDSAARVAATGWLVTFGIQPTRPETGYGYIEAGDTLADGVRKVKRFVEKPAADRAQAMLEAEDFSWNSGMFMLGAANFLAECQQLSPETYAAAANAFGAAKKDLDFLRLDDVAFSAAPDISVDYAIFERTTKAAVLPVSFSWSDLGSWDAVWSAHAKDGEGNVRIGSSTLSNTSNALIFTDKAHVVVEGLDDVVVIASEDAIFVGRLSQSQKVGALTKRLRADTATRPLTEIHRTAYRPWGGYSSVLQGERFQVKRLFVNPGKKLSLQRHHHRSEHWVVVRGTAQVTVDGVDKVLSENESIYLPLGCTHRLANPGKILLELIEVQTGSYLGEDDIVRIEDEFGRS
jgi:mannose-1-phosphate guanylyltransferase